MTEAELNQIKGLLHYFSQNLDPKDSFIGIDARLTDANGDPAGVISYSADEDVYVWKPV